MANSTIGQLYSGDFAVNKARVAAAPLSGAGQNRLFDTGDFADVINGNWQRVAGSPLSSAQGARLVQVYQAAPFIAFGSVRSYKVEGQTQLAGVPFPALVTLYQQAAPSAVFANAYTDASGNYSFELLPPGRYIVLGIDANTLTYNGVVYAMVDAVPM